MSTVGLPNTVQPTATGDLGTTGNNHVVHPISLKRNQPSNSKIPGNATGNTASTGANTHRYSSQFQFQRSNSKNSGNSGPNNRSSQFFRNTTNNFDYRESQRQPHARFDERYNQRYSPPVFPLTPSLNSSFPEALSRSLLQIAENQSRTIDAMKPSQEAQTAAYKEMTKSNKMRDNDVQYFTPVRFMTAQILHKV